VTGFERSDSNFERGSVVGKMPSYIVTTFSKHHPDQLAAINIEAKRSLLAERSDDDWHF
jgi:hypothetical protein